MTASAGSRLKARYTITPLCSGRRTIAIIHILQVHSSIAPDPQATSLAPRRVEFLSTDMRPNARWQMRDWAASTASEPA
jgi:hypothetical protein